MKWTFEQIEGPSAQRKTQELDGWNAPFGRPRREAVMKELIRSRIQTTRYPGGHNQTRHAFGTNWEPFDMRGRWMTKATGVPADETATNWILFVKDERTVRIAWGSTVSFIGYIEELELERESHDEIAWRMKIHIDTRDDIADGVPIISNQKSALGADDLATLLEWKTITTKFKPPKLEIMSTDFLDFLDSIAGLMNTPSAILNRLAGEFDDFEKATFNTLQHFRGALTGFRQAALTMQAAIVNADIDTAMLIRSADDDVRFVRYQTRADNDLTLLLADAADLDRRLELAAQAKTDAKLVVAREGDTWESISSRATGGTDKASAIRDLAGAQYGARPIPGEGYLVL